MGKARRPVRVRRRGHVCGLFGSPDSLAQVVTNDAFRIALLQLLQWTAVKLGLHAVYAVISQRVGKRYPWLERFLQWVPTIVATFMMTTANICLYTFLKKIYLFIFLNTILFGT